MVELRVLGRVEVVVGGKATTVAPKPAMLATLLARETGREVSVDVVTDTLWPEAPPTNVRKIIATYVHSCGALASTTFSQREPAPTGCRTDRPEPRTG